MRGQVNRPDARAQASLTPPVTGGNGDHSFPRPPREPVPAVPPSDRMMEPPPLRGIRMVTVTARAASAEEGQGEDSEKRPIEARRIGS